MLYVLAEKAMLLTHVFLFQVDRKFLRNMKKSRARNLSTAKQLIVAKYRKEQAAK